MSENLPEKKSVVGEESTGRVDYAIKALKELICIMEGKQHQIAIGFAQVSMPTCTRFMFKESLSLVSVTVFSPAECYTMRSAFQTNKRKRKADDAFGEEYDYLFGIVTTATEFRNLLNIRFVEEEGSEDEKELCKNVEWVMELLLCY